MKRSVIKIEDKVRNIDGKDTYCGGSTPYKYEDVKRFIELESESGCKLVTEEYVNSKTKIFIECPCSNVFETSFGKFKTRNKRLCNTCSKAKRAKSTTKTHNQFVEEIKTITNNEFEVLSNYKKDDGEVIVKHIVCDSEFEVIASTFLQAIKKGTGCKKCSIEESAKNRTMKQSEFVNRVKELVGDEYRVSGNYVKSRELVSFIHEECGFEFDMAPNSFFNGRRCPKCGRERISQALLKSHSTFVEEVKDRVGDEYTVLDEYKNSQTKIKMRHNKCNREYEVAPNKFLSGDRCPHCNLSKGARFIPYLLDVLEFEYVREKRFEGCVYKTHLPFDFFVEDKILIEYDGDFHFIPGRFSKDKEKMLKRLKETQRNDRIKNQYCIDNNISFIRIPCWEIENLKEIVLNALMYLEILNKDEFYNEGRGREFLVESNWNHDEYVSKYKRAYWLEAKENCS